MAYRGVLLKAVLLVVISMLSKGISAASIDKLSACPAGELPKCTISVEYKTIVEKYAHPYNCDWYFLCSNGVPYCLQCEEGTIYNPETERCDNTVRIGCVVETTPAPTTLPPTTPLPPPPTTTTAPTTPPTTPPPPTTTTTAPTTPPPPTTTTTAPTTPPPPPTTTTAPTTPPTTPPPPTTTTTAPTTPPPPPTTTTTAPTTPPPTPPPPPTTTRAPTTTPPPPPTTTTTAPTTPPPPPTTTTAPTTPPPTTPPSPPTTTAPTTPPPTTPPPPPTTTTAPTTPLPTTPPSPPTTTAHTTPPSTTPQPTAAPTTQRPTLPPADPEPKCPACARDGPTFRHPTNCQWFYECTNGIPVLRQCVGGLHWNARLQVCDYPCFAGCSLESQSIPVGLETPGGSETTVCPAADAPACPAQDPRMAVLLPHTTSCSWYFECSNGIPYCMPCPAGEHFNPKLKVCDYPEHAGCGTADIIPRVNEEPPKETISLINEPSSENENSSTSIQQPDTPENGVKNVCPAANAPACPAQDPRMAVLLAHPTSCEWYFECSNGISYCMPCPAGEHFNPKLKICDYPEHAGCGAANVIPKDNEEPPKEEKPPKKYIIPYPVEPKPEPPANSVKYVCPAAEVPACPAQDPRMAVLLAHPTSCEWYFECSNGIPYCMPCPIGEYFNPKLKVCDYPENSGCGASSGTIQETESRNEITTGVGSGSGSKTVSETGSGSRTGNEVQTVCPAVDTPACSSQDLLAHPTSCSWYFQCSNGIPYCMPCPAGLYFNDKLKVCDYPQNSGCNVSS